MLRVLTMLAIVLVGVSPTLADAIVKEDGAPVFVDNKRIAGSVEAKTGARIRTGETGYATVYYKDGCTKVVEARQTYIVEHDPVCEEAYYDYDKKEALIVGGVIFGGLTAYILTRDDDPASP